MVCDGCTMRGLSLVRLSGVELWEWLLDHNVVVGEKLCPKCDSPARVDTWLGDSTTCMKDVIIFCNYWLFTSYPKTEELMGMTNFSRQTAKSWSSFCRGVCMSWANRPSQHLGGPNTTVEIAVTQLCKREDGYAQPIANHFVLGAIERGTSKAILVPVDDDKEDTLLQVVKEKVRPATRIISNCWNSCDTLSAEGFQHVRIKSGTKFVSADDPQIHTQTVRRMWRDAKECVPKYCRTKPQFQGYLSEYVFRRAYRFNERLHHFLIEASLLYPPSKNAAK